MLNLVFSGTPEDTPRKEINHEKGIEEGIFQTCGSGKGEDKDHDVHSDDIDVGLEHEITTFVVPRSNIIRNPGKRAEGDKGPIPKK